MNRKYLVDTLELIKPALAKNNTVPIFQSYCFEPGSVSAYNDTVGICGPVDHEDSFGVHGTTLLGMLSASSAEEVAIVRGDNELTLKAGKSVTKLPYDPEENFIFKEPGGKWDIQIPYTQTLHEALELCLKTVSNDETQLALHGVTIEGNHLYSCNGDTITKIKIKDGSKSRFLMPTPFCEAVVKLWSSLEMTKGILKFNKEWVHAHFEDWSVYGRVLEIKEPIDFENLIKRTVKGKPAMVEIPDGFSEALSRARVLADPESQRTVFKIGKGKAELYTETPMGTVHDVFELRGHGDVECSINASHVQRSLDNCDLCAFTGQATLLSKGDDIFILISNMG